jgi:hypothetical protein
MQKLKKLDYSLWQLPLTFLVTGNRKRFEAESIPLAPFLNSCFLSVRNAAWKAL